MKPNAGIASRIDTQDLKCNKLVQYHTKKVPHHVTQGKSKDKGDNINHSSNSKFLI